MTGITRYLKKKCTAWQAAFQDLQRAEAESPMEFLPDRLVNPEDYELPFSTVFPKPLYSKF